MTEATLLSTVDSSGSVAPESKVTLSFGTSGTVNKVNVQPGDRVKKGDVLAELDTRALELQVAQQQQVVSEPASGLQYDDSIRSGCHRGGAGGGEQCRSGVQSGPAEIYFVDHRSDYHQL